MSFFVKFAPLLCLLCLAACTSAEKAPVVLPTLAQPEGVRTAIVKTLNAPPVGFETISFDPIDRNRDALPSWHFEIVVNFEGQYTQTNQPSTASLRMNVWEDSVFRRRRVLLEFTGEALNPQGVTRLEAVRFENDFYLLDSNGVCTYNSPAAQEIGALEAGRVVGGLRLAIPVGVSETVENFEDETLYQYGFSPQDVSITLFNEPPSAVSVDGGEAWLLARYNVIARFGLALTVHHARVLFGQEPVTGLVRYEYHLLDVGQDVEISLPNGC